MLVDLKQKSQVTIPKGFVKKLNMKGAPENTSTRHSPGFAYAELIRCDDTIGAYRQALRIDPIDLMIGRVE